MTAIQVRAGDEDTPRRAPDFTSHADRIAARLAAWRDRPDASDKLVWVLDHDYSEAGLSFDALKNVDAALARTLAPAAAVADCELYAAIVHATVHGDATYDPTTSMAGEIEATRTRAAWRSRPWVAFSMGVVLPVFI